MNIPLLNDILIIVGLALSVSIVFQKLKLPTIVGFLFTGIIGGPHGFGLVKAAHNVEVLAEIGVVLLLFSIGLEFSFKELLHIKRAVFMGGTVQVALTALASVLAATLFGLPLPRAVFIGFLISLSSTAIVLKILQEKSHLDTPYGRTSLGILLFQDIIVIPMMIFTPLLSGMATAPSFDYIEFLGKTLFLLGFIFASYKWLIPWILYQAAKSRNPELFLITVSLIGFSIAWLTAQLGLSLALGAFIAGLIIAESEYSQNAISNIIPLRDLFMSFFFVSIGMLLDMNTLLSSPVTVFVMAISLVAIKLFTTGLATLLLGYSLPTALLAAFTLSQIGEFSFILSKVGKSVSLISGRDYQLFLAIAITTMMATPFLHSLGQQAVRLTGRMPLPQRWKSPKLNEEYTGRTERLSDHIIIIGFGLNGRNLAHAARSVQIPYVVIEANPDTVRVERKKGEHIYFGDATYEHVLENVGLQKARVVVIAISDPLATRRITYSARRLNPKINIIARTRYVSEMASLYDQGANEVIPEEFETSIEIFTRVLQKYLVSKDQIDFITAEIRASGYAMLRERSMQFRLLSEIDIPDVQISKLTISSRSGFAGKNIGDLKFRQDFGINILAIFREGKIISRLDPQLQLRADDQLLVLGHPSEIAEIAELLNPPK